MTTTVLELLANLKHYPDHTLITIRDVDDVEFAIVDFQSEANNSVTIIIEEKVESEGDEGEG
ncbi:hypothetical protein [Nostoc sp. NMS4]|uniref:hypothetical protein n=1 Tax=Nostoc sp. NMS4 TaxID=2815390 RepID=UPI0025F79CB4|nr:hypothetical protein [Nostoc sp. NMS4]MBN3926102.1 hypothetical protein [Nostoc sp. NMS4]